jgi:sigma-E factor negative regulatory protein RseA
MKYVNEQESSGELLSALADGELDAAQTALVVQTSKNDARLMQDWASYHTIGEVLRARAGDARSTVNPAPVRAPVAALHSDQPLLAHSAANDSVFRWKLVAGVAALAAVGSMVWALVGGQNGPAGAQLAQRGTGTPVAPVVAGVSIVAPDTKDNKDAANKDTAGNDTVPVMIRDPRLDELMAAHKQFGGASALQQPAGFLRNATFQPTGR